MTKAGFLSLHRSLALVFAPLLLLQALTGVSLLFRGQLARIVDPSGMTAQGSDRPAATSRLVAAAAASAPDHAIRRLFLPESRDDTVFVELAGANGSSRFASLDPASARVLAAGSVWRFPLEAALRLHHRLLDGGVGLALVTANSMALALLASSGFCYWWPGRRRALKALAIPSAAPQRMKLRLWHRSIGVTLSAVVLFSATTGLLLVVPDLAQARASAKPDAQPARSAGEIDRAVNLAQAEFPGARMHDIRFPPADRIDANFSAPERNSRALHSVSVEASRGVILKRIPAQSNGALWMTVLPLHSGGSFGLAGRLVLLLEACVLCFLAISGPTMWWRARRAKRGRK